MKILLLTYRPPYPPISGEKLRAFQLIQILKKHHEIFLLTFISNREQLNQAQQLKNMGIKVETVLLNRFVSNIKTFFALFRSTTPLQVAFYSSEHMKNRLRDCIIQNQIDILYVQLARMGQYFTHDAPCIKVLDFMDSFSQYYYTRYKIDKNIIAKWLDYFESKRYRIWEQKLNSLYDFSTIISSYDAIQISAESPPIVIQNHVDDFLNYNGPKKYLGEFSIVFFGEIGSYYSESAISFFTKEIFPFILKEFPEAKFYVVGSNPTKKVLKLECNNIKITGFVDDIREYIAGSRVSICPLMMGSGLKNKIIQSMALKVPVVATSISNRGINGENGKHLIIADNPKDFAFAVNRLFKDMDFHNWIKDNAYIFIEKHFSSYAVSKKLDRLLNECSRLRSDRLSNPI